MAQPDMALVDPDGRTTALVEVRRKRGTSQEWAHHWLRNWSSQAPLPPHRYFLLVALDKAYLWLKGRDADLPSYVFDTTVILRPYLERAQSDERTISSEGFELIVGEWLDDLLRGDVAPQGLRGDAQAALVDSGLLGETRRGSVLWHPAN